MALVPFPSKADTPVPRDEVEPDWDDSQPEDGGKMSFLEHLDELRRRIIYSVASVFAGFLIAFFFIRDLYAFVMEPMSALLPDGRSLIFTEPTEPFFLWLKIAAIAGVLIASPVVMSQVWLFVAPGLYSHEKKLAIPFVALTSIFFILGAMFSHYVVFPVSFQFFIGFETEFARAEIRVAPAFSLWAKLLFAFGLVFQMPSVVLFLSKIGVVTPRFMLQHFKYAVLVIFVVAAVITPPDVVSQILMAGPMIVLYLLSVGIAWVFQRKRPSDEE
jgi:sec-independent protein translocase protein TatC